VHLLLQVQPSSPEPIYRQLVDQVAALWSGGRLLAGEFLPSVRQVAEQLQINPMTVSKAWSLLERSLVVEHVRGHGMRVLPRPAAARLEERLAELSPLLDAVAMRAHQLALPPPAVLDRLHALLKEPRDA
jgi:GntR family transcriptional regulator